MDWKIYPFQSGGEEGSGRGLLPGIFPGDKDEYPAGIYNAHIRRYLDHRFSTKLFCGEMKLPH
jgi:hypothetical protein